MHLIRLLLPLYDNDGNRFPAKLFDEVFDELTNQVRRHHRLSALTGGGGLETSGRRRGA